MKVLSWNVQGAFPWRGSKDRIRNQIHYISEDLPPPDLLMLNEVTTLQREYWHDLLADIGYSEIVDTLDWALELRESDVPPHQDIGHVNGNLTAIHANSDLVGLKRSSPSIRNGPAGDSELKHWDTNYPEKILNAEVELGKSVLDLWNIRTVPGSMYGEEKIKILENVYDRILLESQKLRILTGDFNAPKAETAQGEVISWGVDRGGDLGERWTAAELNILTKLDQVGMEDVFRSLNGYGDIGELDVSHPTSTGESIQGKRFDHTFASKELNAEECYYDRLGLECSDHAPMIATFNPDL